MTLRLKLFLLSMSSLAPCLLSPSLSYAYASTGTIVATDACSCTNYSTTNEVQNGSSVCPGTGYTCNSSSWDSSLWGNAQYKIAGNTTSIIEATCPSGTNVSSVTYSDTCSSTTFSLSNAGTPDTWSTSQSNVQNKSSTIYLACNNNTSSSTQVLNFNTVSCA